MKKAILAIASIAILSSFALMQTAPKVTLCHKNPKNRGCLTIEVDSQYVATHLAHGDSYGACSTPCN